MQNPRTFVAALVLTLLFALSTTAVGQAGTSCDPGQIMTPCSSANQTPAPGEISTPAAVAPGQIDTPPMGQVSLTKIASSVLLRIVSLF